MTIYSIFSLRGSVTLVMACLMTSMFCHAQSVQRDMCMQYKPFAIVMCKEKESEKLVDYGVGQFPHNPYFLDAKGELLMKKGKKKEALAIWEKIIAIDSNWPSYGSDFSKMILNM